MLVASAGAFEEPPGEKQQLLNLLEPDVPGPGSQAPPQFVPIHEMQDSHTELLWHDERWNEGREVQAMRVLLAMLLTARTLGFFSATASA